MHVLARAGLFAGPTAVVLAIFVEACGAFHGCFCALYLVSPGRRH